MSKNPEVLIQAVARLWARPRPGPDNLLADTDFLAIQKSCEEIYPNAGKGMTLSIALCNAVRSLGLPCLIAPERPELGVSAENASSKLIEALERTNVRRMHLCPLDLADTLPSMSFGRCRIHRFTSSELAELFRSTVLERCFPNAKLDTERFSRFSWLVIDETSQVDGEPGKRALPFFYEKINSDAGRIEPHTNKLPSAVELALFFVLLAPWEEWVEMPTIDWRPFQIPWTHTSSDDIFEQPAVPRSADSLNWETKVWTTTSGEEVEFDVPVNLPLSKVAQSVVNFLTPHAWDDLQKAIRSSLFETPIIHFAVRAFFATGIDEFLAFLTVAEAALGVESDYKKSKNSLHPKVRGTKRIAARVSALLGSNAHGETYSDLFNLRSAFIHGREMQPISTIDRIRARSLARRIAIALVRVALSQHPPLSREEFANDLLDRGLQM